MPASEYGMPSRSGGGNVATILVALVFVLAILLPIAAQSRQQREERRRAACIATLKKVTQAKIAWQEDTRASCDDEPTVTQLLPYLKKVGLDNMPTCPSSGEYHLGTVENEPTCDFDTKINGVHITHVVPSPLTN